MHIVHLTASTFYGGPERQMLGLAKHLPAAVETSFLSFSEHGRCAPFLRNAREAGFDARELEYDTPDFRASVRAIVRYLRHRRANVLLAHGYKANLLGRIAARRVGIPIVGVSRGWTGETIKVRCYDALDKAHLRCLDRVVCVSDAQAAKVRTWGVPENRVRVIRNAARCDDFHSRDACAGMQWQQWTQGGIGILAAGRFSPEKGFTVLAEAVKRVVQMNPTVRFVLFGAGPEHRAIEAILQRDGTAAACFLAGFRSDLDTFLPWADIVALPSFTEGLPNIVLEAACAGVPVVASAVGGTPEAVRDGVTGYLVPAGDREALAQRLLDLAANRERRMAFGTAARRLMQTEFSFAAQAEAYLDLFGELECVHSVSALQGSY